MIREVDIRALVQNIRRIGAEKPKELSEGVRYLYERLYAPLQAEQTVTIGDIDFTRFTHEESWDFAAYINGNVLVRESQAEALYRVFSESPPKALPQRTFF